jgi:hypothetical protein
MIGFLIGTVCLIGLVGVFRAGRWGRHGYGGHGCGTTRQEPEGED